MSRSEKHSGVPSPSVMSRILKQVRRVLLGAVVAYVLAVLLVMTPFIQTRVLYAHHIDFLWYNKFDHPENYGLAPGKTVNLQMQSSDNLTLGAWFLFSDPFYRSLPYPPPSNTDFSFPQRQHIPTALQTHPTILFLHGNTGTRAHHLRTALYTAFTSRLAANVLAIDYRGFGDSEGHPTVQGVGKDAKAGWDYLISQGAKPEDVLIVGHSLGTAIAGLLAAELGREGIHPRGTVLMSPFSSVRKLIDEYYLFGFLPLLRPLSVIPLAPRLVTWSLVHRFDTLTLVPDIKSSVLIAHADDDKDIPVTHASLLFDAFLSPYLPPPPLYPLNPLSPTEWDNYTSKDALRASKRHEVVSTVEIDGYGVHEEMQAAVVALLRTRRGGHDIGRVEGVQDAIGGCLGFY
ncbi:Alpha/Beta hydrolase protein [Gymnopilus junonius]|uniref:Alpha/Beta hydrolase protein n=1 Tax=Gymnopilus junonius TaxID=109634 RepID=A0A9P5NMU2_GYMJU|nr:Alpha/Beta hydrolase protein [Gymnopilus junonius]